MSKRCMGCMEIFGDEFEICPHCGYVEGTKAEEAIHMEPGTILHDRYRVGKVLGFGGFGVTYIGWDGKLEQKVAIKEYLPSEFSTRMPGQSAVTVFNGEKGEQFNDGMNKFVEEAKHLAKFQNEPGIVKIFDSFTENGTAYIIMEFLDGETLTTRLKRDKTISEDEAVKMLWPIMESLQIIHSEGLLHRDIAPDNIFITKDGEVKLIDFGASRYATTSHSRSLTVIIKPGYSPEEQYRSRGDQGPHTDVYALAATLYKMITGKTPPDAMERRAKIENQKKEILEDPTKLNKKISLNRENAILNAMNVRIEDRTPDIQAFMDELNADPPAKRRYGKIKKIDLYSWPLWLKILISSLLAALVILGVLLATGIISFPSLFTDEITIPEGMTIVPDVEGMDKDAAFEALEKQKLFPSPEGNVESEYIEAGKIVLQSPQGGCYLEENEKVVLTVSSGKGVVAASNGISTVPYVIWDTKEDAISKLLQAGLAEPTITTKSDDNVAAGKVISQSVDSGKEIPEGTKITIVVSSGPASFDMISVVGKSLNQAKSSLEQKGLKVNVTYEKNSSVTEGSVISQSIAAGKKVKKADAVTLTVSSGKPVASVANVVSKTQNSATETLKNQGFKVSAFYGGYSSSIPYGSVLSQSPAAGTSQIEGSTISLVLSKGPDWSTYSNSLPSGVTESQYEIRTQTLYRYRDKQHTTSSESSLSGWESEGSDWSWSSYGSWSGWSTNYVAKSDSRNVETRTIPATYKTQYNYSRYTQNSNDTGKCGPWKGNWGGIYCQYYFEKGWNDTQLSVKETQRSSGVTFNCYGPNGNWFNETTKQVEVTSAYTEYRYQDRSKVYTYKYWKWGSWSNYTTTKYTSSSDRNVETITQYSYRRK